MLPEQAHNPILFSQSADGFRSVKLEIVLHFSVPLLEFEFPPLASEFLLEPWQ